MLFYLRMCVTKLYFFILCCCYCIFVFQKQKIPLYHTINVYIAVMENRIKKWIAEKRKHNCRLVTLISGPTCQVSIHQHNPKQRAPYGKAITPMFSFDFYFSLVGNNLCCSFREIWTVMRAMFLYLKMLWEMWFYSKTKRQYHVELLDFFSPPKRLSPKMNLNAMQFSIYIYIYTYNF